jgi:hypothetical protein
MYKYLEISHDKTKEVVSRMDVSGMSQRQIDKVWDGASINLNHKEYSISEKESDIELQKINRLTYKNK